MFGRDGVDIDLEIAHHAFDDVASQPVVGAERDPADGREAFGPDFRRALSHCRAKSTRGLRLTDFYAAATASRHVVIAAARSTRCDLADVRWRWTLKVL